MIRLVAVYSPRLRTVTIVTEAGVVPIDEDRVLIVAELLDRAARFVCEGDCVGVRIIGDDWLVVTHDNAVEIAELAEGVRDAFAIPAHVAALTAEAAV